MKCASTWESYENSIKRVFDSNTNFEIRGLVASSFVSAGSNRQTAKRLNSAADDICVVLVRHSEHNVWIHIISVNNNIREIRSPPISKQRVGASFNVEALRCWTNRFESYIHSSRVGATAPKHAALTSHSQIMRLCGSYRLHIATLSQRLALPYVYIPGARTLHDNWCASMPLAKHRDAYNFSFVRLPQFPWCICIGLVVSPYCLGSYCVGVLMSFQFSLLLTR